MNRASAARDGAQNQPEIAGARLASAALIE
jgi:hypothetical protein